VDPAVVVAHTGLLAADGGEPLFAVFVRNSKFAGLSSGTGGEGSGGSWPWFLAGYHTEPFLVNPAKMSKYSTTQLPKDLFPLRVTYWDKTIGELCFDPTVPVLASIDFVHLEEKQRMQYRVPYPYSAMSPAELIARIKDGTTKALVRVEGSPRLAVPQFFRDKNGGGKGEAQMLLPIRLVRNNPTPSHLNPKPTSIVFVLFRTLHIELRRLTVCWRCVGL